MRHSASRGDACSIAGVKRVQSYGIWRSRNGCSIKEACCRMPLAGAHIIGCDALLDLKELLCSVPRQQRDIVLRTPHHPLGGADAKITEPTEGHSARTISGVAEGPTEARVASRDPREDDPTAGASAARARYQNSLAVAEGRRGMSDKIKAQHLQRKSDALCAPVLGLPSQSQPGKPKAAVRHGRTVEAVRVA